MYRGYPSAVASSVLTITPAHPPAKLAFLQQPENALTGAVISPAVQVQVEDADGNLVANATNVVTLALTAGTGLGGTLTATAQNGIASFSNLTVSTAGNYTLLATSTGLTSATSAAFTVTTPVKLAFLVQPSNAVTGAAISPAVQVAIQDADGNTVTAAANPVTIALTSAAGLQGTLTATPQKGVATFSNLSRKCSGKLHPFGDQPWLDGGHQRRLYGHHPGKTRVFGAAFECADRGRDRAGCSGRNSRCQRKHRDGRHQSSRDCVSRQYRPRGNAERDSAEWRRQF